MAIVAALAGLVSDLGRLARGQMKQPRGIDHAAVIQLQQALVLHRPPTGGSLHHHSAALDSRTVEHAHAASP